MRGGRAGDGGSGSSCGVRTGDGGGGGLVLSVSILVDSGMIAGAMTDSRGLIIVEELSGSREKVRYVGLVGWFK